jgi:hypothetical protein
MLRWLTYSWTAYLPLTITKVRDDIIGCDCTPADLTYEGANVAANTVTVSK